MEENEDDKVVSTIVNYFSTRVNIAGNIARSRFRSSSQEHIADEWYFFRFGKRSFPELTFRKSLTSSRVRS